MKKPTTGAKDRDKAQKLLTQGKLDKALEEFRLMAEANPKDYRIRMKVGEVLAKMGKKDEAIKTYEEVAEAYADGGFVVQAIAVNKLILELDPSRQEIETKLAELYSSRGMKVPEGRKATAAARPGGEKVGEFPVVPLFPDLNQEEFARIMSGLTRAKFNTGDWIIREGDKGETIYIISQGRVSVYKKRLEEEIQISSLGEGEFFGEFSFFMSHRRQASVKAEEEVELLVIEKEELDKIVEEYPRVSDILVKFYKERVLDMVLAISPLFTGLGQEERKELIGKFNLMVVDRGDTVIQEGDEGDALYLIKDGEFSVSTTGMGDQPVVLATLRSGDFFGEVALISDQPRTATVTALSRGRLMRLSREDFTLVSSQFPQILEVAQSYLQKRAEETISTMMMLEEGGTDEVVI